MIDSSSNIFSYSCSKKEIFFYLVRHGESFTNNNSERFVSNNDEALTENGMKQAEDLGGRIKANNLSFDYFFSSSMLRAKQTSKILSNKINFNFKDVIFSKRLNELSIGEWNNKEKRKCLTPKVSDKMVKTGKWFSTDRGESAIDVQFRFYNWIKNEVLSLNLKKNTNIIVVSHSQWMKIVLQYILNFDYKEIEKININKASVTTIKFSDNGWELIAFNERL